MLENMAIFGLLALWLLFRLAMFAATLYRTIARWRSKNRIIAGADKMDESGFSCVAF